ncbi:MAG: glycine cleavage system protein GcvH [Flavobacteriales bacterium]|jgi:glycine cleavage system H protein|uniref:glycine cleavage system protein GcvH n=1 Tax=Blattabacterium sp. (Mastotermes darwiniensis) TaxID=39768 RepID=UPI000231DFBA|nr:glycine cleavage system protein GcvH [Blattabacterium sp. (Mastotermes darwiniensis)]AER40466.1 glycine cleavage system protein H [Blattabacterium sp. (Mastotermes darwiniensis) str. MADAR]MDR1805018.1 glycine cleavage system protein GcvH [Flavobacteriales bacterium]
MNPNNLKYSKNHEWIGLDMETVNKNEKAYVGITHFAQNELGDIVYLDIEDSIVGTKIKGGNVFGTIEAVKTVSDLFMPVSGIILEFNKNLLSHPEYINKNSYDKGWILQIKILNKKEYHELMSLEEYKKYIGKKK